MASLTVVVVVILTSAGAFVVACRGVGLRRAALPGAFMQALDCLGLAVLFLLGNLGLGLVLVLGLRVITGRFISLYILNDATLPFLSLLQALVVHSWRARSK
jgi:hypothetical protein